MIDQPHRISGIPEILAFIFKSARGRDRASLLRVSRRFFSVGVPVVWEHITQVEYLFRLLPGVVKATSNSKISINTYRINFSTGNARFDLYAPLVKHVEIKNVSKTFKINDPCWFLRLIESRPLLPNLVDLALAFSQAESSHDTFIWTRMFLAPSLKSIRVVPGNDGYIHRTSRLIAGSLLGQIINCCPKLESLSLLPAIVWESSSADDYSTVSRFDTTFFDRIDSLRFLTRLSCTTGILTSSHIHVLSSLTKLESLDIHDLEGCRIAVPGLTSPPPLKHLGVHGVSWSMFEAIWALGFSESLTSISISTFPYIDDEEQTADSWNSELIHCLSLLSPSIRVLNLGLGDDVWDCNDASLLQPLSTLSLTSVCFTSPVRMNIATLDHLAAILPVVSSLEFCDSTFDHHALACFARLPSLQHLALNICCDMDDIELGNLPTSRKMTTLEFRSQLNVGQDIHLFAQYLLTLWPNLQHIIEPQALPSRTAEQALQMAMVSRALRDIVALRRKLDRLESGIVKEYGSVALYGILR